MSVPWIKWYFKTQLLGERWERPPPKVGLFLPDPGTLWWCHEHNVLGRECVCWSEVALWCISTAADISARQERNTVQCGCWTQASYLVSCSSNYQLWCRENTRFRWMCWVWVVPSKGLLRWLWPYTLDTDPHRVTVGSLWQGHMVSFAGMRQSQPWQVESCRNGF